MGQFGLNAGVEWLSNTGGASSSFHPQMEN